MVEVQTQSGLQPVALRHGAAENRRRRVRRPRRQARQRLTRRRGQTAADPLDPIDPVAQGLSLAGELGEALDQRLQTLAELLAMCHPQPVLALQQLVRDRSRSEHQPGGEEDHVGREHYQAEAPGPPA